jgi:hypothetical protein
MASKANYTGRQFEKKVYSLLNCDLLTLATQVKTVDVDGNDFHIDLKVTSLHLDKPIIIEAKYQEVTGTVDQKLHYVFDTLDHLMRTMNSHGVLVYGGSHYTSLRVKNIIHSMSVRYPNVKSVRVDNVIDFVSKIVKDDKERHKVGRGKTAAACNHP